MTPLRMPDECEQPNIREAWMALGMIREAVELLAPVGAVPNGECLEPSFMAEADALVKGIMAIAHTGQGDNHE